MGLMWMQCRATGHFPEISKVSRRPGQLATRVAGLSERPCWQGWAILSIGSGSLVLHRLRYSSGGVEVQHDFMVVRVTGTSYTASYCKALNSSLGTFQRRAIITLP
jgi:hypothetical protein